MKFFVYGRNAYGCEFGYIFDSWKDARHAVCVMVDLNAIEVKVEKLL